MTDPLKLADEAEETANIGDMVCSRQLVRRLASALREQEKTIRVLRFAANLRVTQGMVKKLRTEAFCEGGELTFCTCGNVVVETAAEAYDRKVKGEEKK